MLEERLAELLGMNATLKLATQGGRVSPWLSAGFFAEDGLFMLRLMMERNGKTLENILDDGRVAVMIESGDPLALFAQGQGRAETPDGVADMFRAALIAKTPPSAALVTLPHLVPVRIRIDRWFLTDVRAGWLPAKELRAKTTPTASIRARAAIVAAHR